MLGTVLESIHIHVKITAALHKKFTVYNLPLHSNEKIYYPSLVPAVHNTHVKIQGLDQSPTGQTTTDQSAKFTSKGMTS